MSLEAGSLEDVTAWAGKEFPYYFSYMVHHPKLKTLRFDGEYLNNRIALQPMLITALPVGQMKTGQIVYAHITGSNDVDLFSEEEVASLTANKKGKEHFQYMKSVVGLADVKLDAPFNYPIETGHPAAIDRLETLIRYAYLANGEATAVQPKLGFFRTHFRGACRDVAQGCGSDVDANEKEDDNTLAGECASRLAKLIRSDHSTDKVQVTQPQISLQTLNLPAFATTRPQLPSSTSTYTPWTRATMISRQAC